MIKKRLEIDSYIGKKFLTIYIENNALKNEIIDEEPFKVDYTHHSK